MTRPSIAVGIAAKLVASKVARAGHLFYRLIWGDRKLERGINIQLSKYPLAVIIPNSE